MPSRRAAAATFPWLRRGRRECAHCRRAPCRARPGRAREFLGQVLGSDPGLPPSERHRGAEDVGELADVVPGQEWRQSSASASGMSRMRSPAQRAQLGHRRAPVSKIGLRNRNPRRQGRFPLPAHPPPASAGSFNHALGKKVAEFWCVLLTQARSGPARRAAPSGSVLAKGGCRKRIPRDAGPAGRPRSAVGSC